jgi:NCAIR mutase (PurE)-related protein
MNETQLRALFEKVREGAVDVDQALTRMRHMPFEDLGFAKVDHHRALRHGMPEVIFGLGKTTEEIIGIAGALLDRSPNVLITRIHADSAAEVLRQFPEGEHFPRARAVRFWREMNNRD